MGSHQSKPSSTANSPNSAASPAVVRRTSFEETAPTSPAAAKALPTISGEHATSIKVSEPEPIPPPPDAELPPPTQSPGVVKNLPPPSVPQTVTLHVDNLEVRKVLEMLSREAKASIVVSPGVTGMVTMDLQNKCLDDALTIIAKLCRLKVRRDGDVVFVSTAAEVRAAEEDNLPVRVYRLNYVRSGDVMPMIKPLLSKSGKVSQSPDSETGLPTDIQKSDEKGSSGNTSEVKKSGGNSLAGGEIVIIQDYEETLQKIDRVIAQIDVQPIQVMIEAVILQVKLEKDMDLGASLAILDDSKQVLGVLGNGAMINAATGVVPATVTTAAGALSSGFATDSYGLKFGFVGNKSTAFIKALEGRGETKILASPRIMVLNKQRAEIHLGQNLGYQDQTTTQTSTSAETKFLKIGTQLRLRPYVMADGMIRMEVHPERSTGALDDEGIPQTNTSQITTNVMVPDGNTFIIGGLIDDEITKDWEGLPYLSDIPWIGGLFRHTFDKTTKKELVIILTPHIWRPETPDALNHLGMPQSLGIGEKVRQRPCAEAKDGPRMLEMVQPQQACPQGDPTPGSQPPAPRQ